MDSSHPIPTILASQVNEISSATPYFVVTKGFSTTLDASVLNFLYQPLIGIKAAALYCFFYYQYQLMNNISDWPQKVKHLLMHFNWSQNELFDVCQVLINYQLLSLYVHNVDAKTIVFWLMPPLLPKDFFIHPKFRQELKATLNDDVFNFRKTLFIKEWITNIEFQEYHPLGKQELNPNLEIMFNERNFLSQLAKYFKPAEIKKITLSPEWKQFFLDLLRQGKISYELLGILYYELAKNDQIMDFQQSKERFLQQLETHNTTKIKLISPDSDINAKINLLYTPTSISQQTWTGLNRDNLEYMSFIKELETISPYDYFLTLYRKKPSDEILQLFQIAIIKYQLPQSLVNLVLDFCHIQNKHFNLDYASKIFLTFSRKQINNLTAGMEHLRGPKNNVESKYNSSKQLNKLLLINEMVQKNETEQNAKQHVNFLEDTMEIDWTQI